MFTLTRAARSVALAACAALMVLPALAATDPHGLFERFAGTWHLSYEVWTDPDGEPLVNHGIERHAFTADGQWKISDFDGTMFGERYVSHGIAGYDEASETYKQWYFDASNPLVQPSEGTWDAAREELVKWSDGADFSGEPCRWKQVVTFPEANAYLLEMFTVYEDGRSTLAIRCQGTRLDPAPTRIPDRARARTALVDRYLAAYAALDIDGMVACYDETTLFEDPTYVMESPEGIHEKGPEAIGAMLRKGLEGTHRMTFDIAQRFEAGERVVLSGRMNTETTGAAFGRPDRARIHWSMPFVTILTVRNDRIVHHLDHIDYAQAVRYLRSLPKSEG